MWAGVPQGEGPFVSVAPDHQRNFEKHDLLHLASSHFFGGHGAIPEAGQHQRIRRLALEFHSGHELSVSLTHVFTWAGQEARRTRMSDPHDDRSYHLAQIADLYSHNHTQDLQMKLLGFILLLSGWGIVMAALVMLHGKATLVFILAGVAVEIVGLALVARAH